MPETSSSFVRANKDECESVSLAEMISALTLALDLTEGALQGHALRCCVLGMRLGAALGVDASSRESLFYALLLKDVGCSSNATRMTQITGGDDRAFKAAAKLADWTMPARVDLRTLKTVWKHVRPSATVPHKLARIVTMAATQHRNNREMIAMRCERGASILRSMRMDDVATEAVYRLDEHWNGSGYPNGLMGSEIPLLARICSVAQNLDVFAVADGIGKAMQLLRKRNATWFDPEIVLVAEELHDRGTLWVDCEPETMVEQTRACVLTMSPAVSKPMTEDQIDIVCEAFSEVVDAKSSYPASYSRGVAAIAVAMAEAMHLKPHRVRMLRRAALLHDIGKLRVPNMILEKTGPLSPEEWSAVLEHAVLTRTILERVPTFAELAVVAGEHHERLDGSGYPLGLKAKTISLESRILALADCFTAMAEDRPYRAGMRLDTIFAILGAQVPERLDVACFEVLQDVVERGEAAIPGVSAVVRPAKVKAKRWGWSGSRAGARA